MSRPAGSRRASFQRRQATSLFQSRSINRGRGSTVDEKPDREAGTEGVSRRDFIKAASVASVVAPQVGVPLGGVAVAEPDTDQVPTQSIVLKVNGGTQHLEV